MVWHSARWLTPVVRLGGHQRERRAPNTSFPFSPNSLLSVLDHCPGRHHDRLLLLHLRSPQYVCSPPSLSIPASSADSSALSPLRQAECVFARSWLPLHASGRPQTPSSRQSAAAPLTGSAMLASSDDAKLIFGTVFSLRNMVRKLGGDDDAFISFRTAEYRLHYYETAANLRFVLLTDTAAMSMRNVLHQIYINLWVEYGASAACLGRGSSVRHGVDSSSERGLVPRLPLC